MITRDMVFPTGAPSRRVVDSPTVSVIVTDYVVESELVSLSLSVPCRTCHAEAGDKCRTLTTNQITGTHRKRLEDWLDTRHPLCRIPIRKDG
jgi:hypothetical protein